MAHLPQPAFEICSPLAETFYVKPNCACRDAIDNRKAVHESTGTIFPASTGILDSQFQVLPQCIDLSWFW